MIAEFITRLTALVAEVTSYVVFVPGAAFALLLESGDVLLTEAGDQLLLEI